MLRYYPGAGARQAAAGCQEAAPLEVAGRGGGVRRARGGAGGPDVDFTLHMPAARIAQLNESDNAKLREVVKVHEAQVAFGQFRDLAASGASVALRAECRAEFLAEMMPGLANPIPDAFQFVIRIRTTKGTLRWI